MKITNILIPIIMLSSIATCSSVFSVEKNNDIAIVNFLNLNQTDNKSFLVVSTDDTNKRCNVCNTNDHNTSEC